MPTDLLPARSRRLSWRQTVALMWLLARAWRLHRQMENTAGRLSVREDEADSAALLKSARRWVAIQDRIATLLNAEPPEHVAELREMFARPLLSGPTPVEPPSVAHPDRAAAMLPK
ncbi:MULTISPECIES: hypothetical protein [Methylorubrum]|uniref:hypothetical protein n=1 Tax=Methylorubrum TaxID=2282523 RepID=UPI0020A09BAC|nr:MULTISPECIES: hypothetical protein [Methylorubrum]MCP1551669.1 hypothetical protein [Methylorubrum zatmanii]MCP1556597.1 hypothetical protein [Methylorubrum extorquens]MCP1582004.1 hypothetical protein [Methylorubrum extorquens]